MSKAEWFRSTFPEALGTSAPVNVPLAPMPVQVGMPLNVPVKAVPAGFSVPEKLNVPKGAPVSRLLSVTCAAELIDVLHRAVGERPR
jgi:hypothetical protein